MTLVDRFLKYVSFDTQSDESTGLTPSTPKQMVFAEYLKTELESLGFLRILGNQEIVNPPPCILFAGFEPIAPPGINPLLLWIQISKGIDKAAFQQNTHLTAFLIREACISAVCLWIL